MGALFPERKLFLIQKVAVRRDESNICSVRQKRYFMRSKIVYPFIANETQNTRFTKVDASIWIRDEQRWRVWIWMTDKWSRVSWHMSQYRRPHSQGNDNRITRWNRNLNLITLRWALFYAFGMILCTATCSDEYYTEKLTRSKVIARKEQLLGFEIV